MWYIVNRYWCAIDTCIRYRKCYHALHEVIVIEGILLLLKDALKLL